VGQSLTASGSVILYLGSPLRSHCDTVGVGNNPNSLALVRRTETTSWKHKRDDLVAKILQTGAYFLESPSSVVRRDSTNVLSDDPAWPDFNHDSKHFRPEVTSVCLAFFLSRLAKGLAGKAAANDVNACKVLCSYIPDVAVKRNAGEILSQHCSAVRLYLDHPRRGDAQRLESEVESADASEEAAVSQRWGFRQHVSGESDDFPP